MRRGNRLTLPHVLPDDQMERMATRGGGYLRSIVRGMEMTDTEAYRLAYRVLEAAGFVAACNTETVFHVTQTDESTPRVD